MNQRKTSYNLDLDHATALARSNVRVTIVADSGVPYQHAHGILRIRHGYDNLVPVEHLVLLNTTGKILDTVELQTQVTNT